VSVAIPRLSGGGAEKVVRLIAAELHRCGRLETVYTGAPEERTDAPALPVTEIGGERAARAALSFLRAVRRDRAGTFLLSLGFINFAPLLRLVHPRARIVLRLGNTAGAEIAGLGTLARLRYLAGARAACRAADAVIVQCDYMGRDAIEQLRVPEAKIVPIYNPVEAALMERTPDPDRPVAAPYIFTAATFKPQKGLDTLLAGFARAPNPAGRRLLIAGIAPGHGEFTAMRRRHGLGPDEVVCLGFLPDIYHYIEHAEICVLTSLYEGFSNFLLESAALGKRIVASDCPGGNRELFAHYDNAEMFAPGDADRLAVLLDSPRRDLALENARARLRAFRFENIYARYCEVLFGSIPTAAPPAGEP
jgi:glycosyltransferase involved in cell wall biosynthesis